MTNLTPPSQYPPQKPGWRRFVTVALPLLCILLFFWLALDTALVKSPTADESVHILRGRVLWQTGDLVLQTQPPLSHWLIGSLLLTEPTLPDVTQLPDWAAQDRPQLADELVWQSNLAIERVFLLARFPIILVGLHLVALLIRWARERYGRPGRDAAALLLAASPALLAFSGLATTDLVVTATYTATVFCWWRYWRRPSWGRWLLAGVALGLALGAKLTALLLLPILLVLAWIARRPDQPWWRPLVAWAGLLPVAGLVLWGLYGFEIRPLTDWPLTVPAATYLDNFLRVQDHISGGHSAFLLGKLSTDGWWSYFIVALLLKTPLPILILCGGAALALLRPRRWRQDSFLWLPAAALFVVASASRLNIGYRHILPVFPFLLVWAAGQAAAWEPRKLGRVLIPLLLLWTLVGGLLQHPHHLAYFNELVGGSRNGYRYLGDSNLDWGQDLALLAKRLDEIGRDDVQVSYFGSASPAYYGLDPEPLFDNDGVPLALNPANPSPGLYAISASHLQGMVLTEPDLFDWFRRRTPTEEVGYSILLYDVPAADTGEWVAHCDNPLPLLEPQTAEILVGASQIRHLYFDCQSSWVLPVDNSPGWYILPWRETPWPIEQLLYGELLLRYAHDPTELAPAYKVYYWPGRQQSTPPIKTTSSLTKMLGEDSATFDSTIELFGYGHSSTGWWTGWRVLQPDTRPLSLSAHLTTDSGEQLVADGLGLPATQWTAGDLLIQFHDFEQPGASLQVGVYDYSTGERLPLSGPNAQGDTISLERLDDKE